MDTGLIAKIIKKFIEGDCTDEEFAYLLYWYESFDEGGDINMEEENTEELRQKILERIRQNIPELAVVERPDKLEMAVKARRIGRIPHWLMYAAAAVALVIVVGTGVYYHDSGRLFGHKKQAEKQNSDLIGLKNESNRIHFIMLPDSSRVWLSPHSKLEYPETFLGKNRQVQLTGEAFFEIHEDQEHPFIVEGGDLVTRVLGTSFLFKAYEGLPAEVAVMTGRVSVSAKDEKQEHSVILSSAQQAILEPGSTVRQLKMDMATVQRWQEVDLSFDNLPLEQVFQALDEKFNIHIHCVSGEIRQCKLKADFNQQKLTDVLEMLERSLNIHYEMVNDSVINFYKR